MSPALKGTELSWIHLDSRTARYSVSLKKKKKDQPPPLSLKGTYRPLQTYSFSSTPIRCQAVNLPSFICKSDDGHRQGASVLSGCAPVGGSHRALHFLSISPVPHLDSDVTGESQGPEPRRINQVL